MEEVLAALETFPPGTAGGRDGLTALHIKNALSVGGSDLLLDNLLCVVNRALAGDMPASLRPYWASAPITPLLKTNQEDDDKAQQAHRLVIVTLSLDFKKSFNSVDRNRMLEEVVLHCPSILHPITLPVAALFA